MTHWAKALVTKPELEAEAGRSENSGSVVYTVKSCLKRNLEKEKCEMLHITEKNSVLFDKHTYIFLSVNLLTKSLKLSTQATSTETST